MDDSKAGRIFQGTELSRLLILLAIALGGWLAVWHYFFRPRAEPAERPNVVAGKPAPVVPDTSVEFETVKDKTPLGFRDMAAYNKLLDEARDPGLVASARRDIFFAHLWQKPEGYRGVPVHLVGIARRVLYYESKLSKTGWLYEAWIFTPDSHRLPYVCVFETAPKGFPIGPNVGERVSFDGYFLKLMAYEAADVPRASPLLVGRIGWAPDTTVGPVEIASDRSMYYLAGGVALMFVLSMIRWGVYLRRSLTPKPRPSSILEHPNEKISPEALSAFLADVPDDDAEPH